MSTRRKTALVTGCTPGGIGAAICEEFKNRGFHVLATARTPSKAASLATSDKNNAGGFIEVLELDVTSKTSIQACAAQVKSRGIEELDVLVNNAGQLIAAPVLDTDVDQARKLFEVNFFSTLTVTQEFAKQLIAAKGTILNVASVAAVLRIAWSGVYGASKAAQASLSDTLRVEMEPLGVKVITAMVCETKSLLYEHKTGSYELPDGSLYKSAESYVAKAHKGEYATRNEPATVTAKDLVDDVVNGASDVTWRGGGALPVRWLWYLLPTRFATTVFHYWTHDRGLHAIGK